MIIHLSEISQQIGKKEELLIPYESEFFEENGIKHPVKNKSDAVFLLNCLEKKKVHLECSFKAEFLAECDRCLREVSIPVELFYEGDVDLDQDEESFDSEELLQREILMEWPAKVLCKESCKGLCMKCGKDLNNGECGCDRQALDPRMAAILDVFNNSK